MVFCKTMDVFTKVCQLIQSGFIVKTLVTNMTQCGERLLFGETLAQDSATINTQRAAWIHFPRKRKHKQLQILSDI